MENKGAVGSGSAGCGDGGTSAATCVGGSIATGAGRLVRRPAALRRSWRPHDARQIEHARLLKALQTLHQQLTQSLFRRNIHGTHSPVRTGGVFPRSAPRGSTPRSDFSTIDSAIDFAIVVHRSPRWPQYTCAAQSWRPASAGSGVSTARALNAARLAGQIARRVQGVRADLLWSRRVNYDGTTMPVPQVAIVGRPNVGKSSVFNWLAGRRLAIVDDMAGVTRDRMSHLIEREGRYLELVDTGGIGIEDVDNLTAEVEAQITRGDRFGRRAAVCRRHAIGHHAPGSAGRRATASRRQTGALRRQQDRRPQDGFAGGRVPSLWVASC